VAGGPEQGERQGRGDMEETGVENVRTKDRGRPGERNAEKNVTADGRRQTEGQSGGVQSGKADLEALLAEGRSIQIYPQGYSMYPLFVPGRDQAVIAPAETEKLKRGDVVLYRRESGILVLHRIWKRTAEGFYMVGDNQSETEGPLRPEQIKGILCRVVRRGKSFSVRNPLYILSAALWLRLRPFRPVLSGAVAGMKRRLRRKKGDKLS